MPERLVHRRRHPDGGGYDILVDEDSGSLVMRQFSELDALLIENAQARSMSRDLPKLDEQGRVIAAIPRTVDTKAGITEAIEQDDMPWLRRWLQDGDHSALRTSEAMLRF